MTAPDLQQQIFAAIRALPAPVSEADAKQAALDVIGEVDASKAREFIKWFDANGSQYCKMLNGATK